MAGASIKVEGLKKLSKELKAISTDLPKLLKVVGKDAAGIVAAEAKSIGPRRTGALVGHVVPGVNATSSFVKVSGLPYVGPIIGGWPKHNIRPNPFIFHALDNKRDAVIDAFQNGVADLIDKSITAGTGE